MLKSASPLTFLAAKAAPSPLDAAGRRTSTFQAHRPPAPARKRRNSAPPLTFRPRKRDFGAPPPDAFLADLHARGAKALKELDLSPRHAIAVGDAENDIAKVVSAGFAVAVADALPALKAQADLVLRRASGRGVAELAARIPDARPSGLYRPA
jgi:haloacid dehalogenase-like hydrolase